MTQNVRCCPLLCRSVCYNDPQVNISPCFFCDDCNKKLHYTVEGMLLEGKSDFEFYEYHHE